MSPPQMCMFRQYSIWLGSARRESRSLLCLDPSTTRLSIQNRLLHQSTRIRRTATKTTTDFNKPPFSRLMSWQFVSYESPETTNRINDREKGGYWRYSNPIEIPLVDERKYELIRLESNELEVLLVSDPTLDRAAISLDVGVGHMSDPEDMSGLAHFCEHLSFMGTKTFPIENDYKKYIKIHGGSTNASTSAQRTTYHFKVDANFLEGAMMRFAKFFYEPSFKEDCVLREVNAVDSENGKNQQMDSRRLGQLRKSLSDEDHPWNKFGCGNKATLLKEGDSDGYGEKETRNRVVDWWEKHYCASRMKVVIIGADSLEKLTSIAIDNFSSIRNKQFGPCVLTKNPPWSTTQPLLIFAKTIQDTQRLELSFPIPHQTPLYRSKPSRWISHLIGHEGPGSIFHFLHRHGLATALSSGSYEPGKGISLLDIDITLTKTGLREYRKVLAVLFHYITLLPHALSQPHHFTELKTMDQIGFNYASKQPADVYAKSLSRSMNEEEYKREHIVSLGVSEWEFNKEDVQDIIDCLELRKSSMILAAKVFEGVEVPQEDEWMKERWYGTEYAKREFDLEGLPVLSSEDIISLYLPEENSFLPESLQVDRIDTTSPLPGPSIIKETKRSTLWHKKDDQFWLPRGSITIRIDTPILHASLSRLMQTRLYVELVKDALIGPGYAAELAGIFYGLSFSRDGVIVRVSGYNDKLLSVLTMVLEHLRSIEITQDRFEVVIEKMKRAYDNEYLRQTSDMVEIFLWDCVMEKLFTAPEKRKELDFTDMNNVRSHAERLFEMTHLTVLVHGNVSHGQAISWLDHIERSLPSGVLSPSERVVPRSLLIPPASHYVFQSPVPNTNETNSGISYLCCAGDIGNCQIRAAVSLLASMMNESFFNIMRTKEQLGYNVQCGTWVEAPTIGLRFQIQSFRHPDFLEARIDAFIHSYLDTLRDMPLDEFEEHKRGAVARKREKLMNMNEERARFWTHIVNEDLEFEQAEDDAREIEKIGKDSLIEFYERRIHPSSAMRSKIAVALTSQAMQPEGQGEQSTVLQGVVREEYKDMIALRANWKLSGSAGRRSVSAPS